MKRLVCIFRGHRWTIRVEDGDSYDVCSRCGKLPQSRAPGAEGFGGSTQTSATATSRRSEVTAGPAQASAQAGCRPSS